VGVADEIVLNIICGDKVRFWDIIDVKTRFLLASHISDKRTALDALMLVTKAATRAGKPPKVIITDELQAYIDGVELAFGAEKKHISAKRLTSHPGTQLIEKFHGSLKDRAQVIRELKKHETAKMLLDGRIVHYNFFRPNEALRVRTPAQKARITFRSRIGWML